MMEMPESHGDNIVGVNAAQPNAVVVQGSGRPDTPDSACDVQSPVNSADSPSSNSSTGMQYSGQKKLLVPVRHS